MDDRRALVIEDDSEIRQLLTLHLTRESLAVDSAASVEEGRRLFVGQKYQLLVLDWMLPGQSGIDWLRELRHNRHQMPVLMVTARAEGPDVVGGLEAGADDYVTKPFDPQVLRARVRALLRRPTAPAAEPRELRVGGVCMDLERHEVTCAGQVVSLTPSEFKLLSALLRRPGSVFTRDQLISLVQGDGVSVVGRTVDTHVFGLRKN